MVLEICGRFEQEIEDWLRANYFVELLGKTVDQLWSDYKAKYDN